MGSELLRIAEGFSIVAEGLRGLAKAEGSTKEKVVKAQPSATEKAQKQDAAQEQPATLEGIRALMAQKTQEGKSKEIRELLQIADFARVGRIAIKPWRGSQYLALQRLTRHRMHITECIAREKTYMLNNIYLKFSEYALLRDGQHPFANKYGATAEAILTEYTTNEDIAKSSVEDLVAFINSKSKGRIADPEETAKILQAAARNSYRLDKCLYEPLTISIASSFNCISSFERELKAIDKAVLQTVQGLNPDEYTVLNSIPGIGKVYSAGILAEMGSIKAFPNANALAKYCGIVWNDNDSGDFVAEDKHMSKAGNRYLRYYIIEAAGSVIRHCPEYKAFYDKKYAETRNHQHKRALALTSRKFIRLLFGLLDKGQLYSPEKSR